MRVSLVILPLALAAVAEAQTAKMHGYGTVQQHEIRSSVNRLKYHLFVSLPPEYSAKDTTRYAVLYALDGNDSFPLIQAVNRYLQIGGVIPKIIIVGVGYPDSSDDDIRRRLDLTPSRDGDGVSEPPSGGAPAFLETLRRDLIPFIERAYHTRGDRALLGHSYGGLFALYALYTAPELFGRYGIFSPATWWGQHGLLDLISNAKQRSAPSATRVFVAVGADEDPGMRSEADSVAAILTRVYGQTLTLTSRRFTGNHGSYFPEALSPGLAFLYPEPACLESLPVTAGRPVAVLSEPDRVEVERFVRNGSNISGRAFQGVGACLKYQLTVDATGKVTAARLEQSLGAPRTTSAEIRASRVRFQSTEPAQERSLDASGPTALYVPRFIASLDQLLRLAPSRIGDSARVLLANFRWADTATGVITRISTDSIRVWHPNVELRVHISDQLEILGGTTIPNGPGAPRTQWVVVRKQQPRLLHFGNRLAPTRGLANDR